MEVKNLDTDYLEYSNDEVFTIVKYLTSALDDKDLNALSRVLCISTLINHITDGELLFSTVRLLKSANLLCEYDDVFAELNNSVFKELQYSENDITRILSFVVSGLLEYEIYSKILSALGITDIESFKYGIEGREVQILNLNALRNKVKKTNAKAIISKSERLNPKDRERYLYEIISGLQLLQYNEETTFFDSEIELYKDQLGLFKLLNFPIKKNSKVGDEDSKYKALKDIFKNSNDDFEPCINELRNADPKIINSKRKYLLGNKKMGAIVAWVDALEFKDFIDKPKDDVLAKLLNEYFENFSITGRSLRGKPTMSYEEYYKHFRNALPQPKE